MSTASAPSENIYQLICDTAKKFPNHNALTFIKAMEPSFIDDRVSYSQLLAKINQTARLFHDMHLKQDGKPMVVSFLLPNIPQASAVLWAAESIGIANPLNPLLNEDALVSLMEKAGTDIIVALGPNPMSDIWQKSVAVSQRLTKQPKLISAFIPAGDEFGHYEDLIRDFNNQDIPPSWQPKGSDIAAYFHTGGTTGTPKLAKHTHKNQLAMVHNYLKSMDVKAADTVMNGLPLFHVSGSLVIGLGSIAVGANMLLPTLASFRDPNVIKRHWEIVDHYKVNITGGIATSVASMANIPLNGADISSIKCMITGGAPTPINVAKEIMKLTQRPLYQIYGLTESAGGIALPNIQYEPVLGSSGYVMKDVQIKVDTQSTNAQAVGEICIRGDMVFAGYLGHSESPIKDGWLRTGDLGYLDENNNLFITGRAKDLIIRSGHNIDPAVIESCLEGHPSVSLAAAVARPDNYAGELPVAYVQLHPDAHITEDELLKYAMAHINERPACPKIISILKELPVTAVGKIHKPTLRALAAKEVIAQALADWDVELTSTLLDNGIISIKVEVIEDQLMAVESRCEQLHESLGLQFTINETQAS